MAMEVRNSEIESFFTKFKSLLYSGYDALLTVKSKNGEAFICLKAGLGPIPSSSDCKIQNGLKSKPSKHRSPSYRRRQERRRKSFEAGHEIKEDASSNVSDAVTLEETGQEVSDIEEIQHGAAEKYACDSCEFISTWENGLHIHVASVHEVSRQRKVALRSAEEEVVFNLTQHYWKTGILERNHQVYINALIDVEQANISEAAMAEEERKLEKLWNDGNSAPT